MSSGVDEKHPLRLIGNSNKIAAVEARLSVIVTFLSRCGTGLLMYLPILTLAHNYRYMTALDQLDSSTKLKKAAYLSIRLRLAGKSTITLVVLALVLRY